MSAVTACHEGRRRDSISLLVGVIGRWTIDIVRFYVDDEADLDMVWTG
jgi:hypothetical protein